MLGGGRSRQARIRLARAVVGVALLAVPGGLAGCNDRMLDTGPMNYVFGGGPPPDTPTLIRPMTGENRTYGNLATVPPRPTDIPSLQQREADMRALETSRSTNREAADTLRGDPRVPIAPAPVTPVPVPPPADVVPGRSSRP